MTAVLTEAEPLVVREPSIDDRPDPIESGIEVHPCAVLECSTAAVAATRRCRYEGVVHVTAASGNAPG